MSRYWVSWYEPIAKIVEHDDENGDLVEYKSPGWPVHVQEIAGWQTGWRAHDDARTYCALLEAPAAVSIERALEDFEVRFINPVADDWRPEATRFPMPAEQ